MSLSSRTSGSEYTARHLTVLEGLEAVRKRPGMYIGGTDERGLMHCVWEIFDNGVDEALGGHATRVEVDLQPDGAVIVRDDGRGVPIDIEPRSGLSGVEVVYTKLHAGAKFGSGSYAASGGLHGVGASVVNALSSRLDVEVDRDGKTYAMSFRRGEPGTFAGHGPDAPFTPFISGSELSVVGKVKRGVTGTRVRYWADPQIFVANTAVVWEELVSRARQTAYLVPGLEVVLRDSRRQSGTPGELADLEEMFEADGGLDEFVEHLASDAEVTPVWRLRGEGTFTETVPMADEDTNQMVVREVERTCQVDIAVRWGAGYDATLKSFVNVITTPHGGTHVSGFEQSLLKVMRAQVAASARRLKVGTDRVERDDVMAGLTAIITVRLAEPQFEGQTKEVLGTPAVRQIVAKVVENELTSLLTNPRRGEKQAVSSLLEKVVAEMKSRISAREHKDTLRRKTALESSSLPAKLYDCRSADPERGELFIVEGDSAMGTAKAARDSEFQALLPIRGKILNVQKASVADVLKNAECADIIKVIGAGSGRTFDLDEARYRKVIIMTDADVDGSHIRTLLLTLFFRYMRPLVEAGRVYAAVPPLHRMELAGVRGEAQYIYTYSEAEMRRTRAELERKGKRVKPDIQRYKGLGEMDAHQLAETTMDPRYRTLRRVTVDDAERSSAVFELLMGSEVAPRREFIVTRSAELDAAQIDA